MGEGGGSWAGEAWSALVASDPGLLRLRLAVRAALVVAVTAYLEHLLGPAVGIPSLVAMLLGGMIGMNGSFASSSRTPRDAAVTLAAFPVVASVGVLPACLLARHRDASLAGFVVAMVLAVLARRFGTRGFVWGMLAFFAYFFATFTSLRLSMYLPVLAVIAVATAVTLLAATVVVPDRPERSVEAALRAFDVRVAALAAASRDAIAEPTARHAADRAVRAVRARSFRVVEAALIIDGQLAAVPDDAVGPPPVVRHALLDAELAVEELAGAALRLRAAPDVPGWARAELVAAFDALVSNDLRAARAAADAVTGRAAHPVGGASEVTTSAVRDVGGAIVRLVEALEDREPAVPAHVQAYQPAVDLFLGNLPGSFPSALGVVSQGGTWWARRSPNFRQSLQVGIAGALTVVAGEMLSSRRYYWALLACFLVLTGTITTGEAATKAVNRVVGTMAGLVAAVVAVDLTRGHDAAVVGVMLACVFVGLYFFRISYAVMTFAVTTLLGLLYDVLGVLTDQLLALRLEETALGAAIGVATALVVLPVRTGAARAAARDAFLAELATLLDEVADRLASGERRTDLLLATRRLDARLHQVALVARPAGGATLLGIGGHRATRILSRYVSAAYRARALAAAVAHGEPGGGPRLAAACRALAARLREQEPERAPLASPGEDGAVGRLVTALGAAVDRLLAERPPGRPAGAPGPPMLVLGRSSDAG